MTRFGSTRLLSGLAGAVWLGLIVAGFAAWERFESAPGAAGPAGPAAVAPDGCWQLDLYVHPRCPCVRPALTELAEVLRLTPVPVSARVLCVRPEGAPDGWERGAHWAAAAARLGVRVGCDGGGREARRAGAATSGHVVLYDPAGRPAFAGGITRGRAQFGESSGRRRLLAILSGQDARGTAPVFGCPLFDADAPAAGGGT